MACPKEVIKDTYKVLNNEISEVHVFSLNKAKTFIPPFYEISCNTFQCGEFTVRLSKTSKVCIRDYFSCSGCGKVAEFASISKIRNADHYVLNFWLCNYKGVWNIMTKDHIMPKAAGGTNSMENFQAMCYDCNQEKSCSLTHEQALKVKEKIEKQSSSLNQELIKLETISSQEKELLHKRVKDFSITRKCIKRSIQNMPWYLKMFGLHKYIEKNIKEPVVKLGYFEEGVQRDREESED